MVGPHYHPLPQLFGSIECIEGNSVGGRRTKTGPLSLSLHIYFTSTTSEDNLRRTNLPSMVDIIIEKNLRWLSHAHRIDNNRLPRQLLYSQLCNGTDDLDSDSRMLLK